MKALILSAGQSKRMQHLTTNTPKPLLEVGKHCLIEHHLIKLSQAGITEVVINTFYLGEMIQDKLGDGSRYGVKINYLPQEELLDSGGDTFRALELLGDEPFILISADIYTEFDYSKLPRDLSTDSLGRLVMVWSPEKHAKGCRYGVNSDNYLTTDGEKWNWSSIGVLHPAIFESVSSKSFPLLGVFDRAMMAGRLEGETYKGLWSNLSTPQDLQDLLKIV